MGGSNIGLVPRLATPSSIASIRQPAAHRIDSEARAQIGAERDVGGGIAQRAASFVAMFDDAFDRERPGQQARGGLAIARFERLADPGGGDRLALLGDRRDRVDRQAVGLAEQLQHLDIAAAALAEGEILAGHYACRADPADQIIGDEIGRGDLGELGPEMEDEHRIGAGLREQPLALVERGQAEGRRIGPEEAHRMRIEGRDQHRPPFRAGAADGAAHHRLVALVEAVEIAERDDAAA